MVVFPPGLPSLAVSREPSVRQEARQCGIRPPNESITVSLVHTSVRRARSYTIRHIATNILLYITKFTTSDRPDQAEANCGWNRMWWRGYGEVTWRGGDTIAGRMPAVPGSPGGQLRLERAVAPVWHGHVAWRRNHCGQDARGPRTTRTAPAYRRHRTSLHQAHNGFGEGYGVVADDVGLADVVADDDAIAARPVLELTDDTAVCYNP